MFFLKGVLTDLAWMRMEGWGNQPGLRPVWPEVAARNDNLIVAAALGMHSSCYGIPSSWEMGGIERTNNK